MGKKKRIVWPDAPYANLMGQPKEGETIAVWFSNGAASACALEETLRRFGNLCIVRPVNNPVVNEDVDNNRFRNDVESYADREIEKAINSKFPSCDIFDVFEKTRMMSTPEGATCTRILKKEARYEWESKNKVDWHVLGFTYEEKHRFNNFYFTERRNTLPVLIDKKITKEQCYRRVRDAGITLPRCYSMASDFGSGYPNANCIGCVKATSPTYWNHVRHTFPEVFDKLAEQSRRMGKNGARLVRYKGKRIFLDELPPDARGYDMKTMQVECGIFC